jgi:hypothetical protein
MSLPALGSTPSQRELQDVASVHRAKRDPNILPARSRHLPDVRNNPEQLHILESCMRAQNPQEWFDQQVPPFRQCLSESVRWRRDDFGSTNAGSKVDSYDIVPLATQIIP